jgi:Tfp pilus assembly protein PilX
MSIRLPRTRVHAECGFALVTGLLLLIVMSLIGVTMMSVTRLETRMAGGARETNIAFQAAEAGLRDAEGSILPNAVTDWCELEIHHEAKGSGRYGTSSVANGFEPVYPTHTWRTGGDYIIYEPNDYPELLTGTSGLQPRYVISHLSDECIQTSRDVRPRQPCSGYCADNKDNCFFVSDFRVTAWGSGRDGTATKLLQTHVTCVRPF